MQFKYIIIFIFSILSAQSQFNPIIGQSLDMGSIRSFSMGHTYMSFPNSSSVVLNSPSSILSIDNKGSLQAHYSLANHFSLERRSIPMKDNFGGFLTYGDYASNRSTYQYHRFGLQKVVLRKGLCTQVVVEPWFGAWRLFLQSVGNFHWHPQQVRFVPFGLPDPIVGTLVQNQRLNRILR